MLHPKTVCFLRSINTLLCAKQVAKIMGVEEHKVYRLWNSGEIASCRIGSSARAPRRCKASDIEDYLELMYKRDQEARDARLKRKGPPVGEPFS